MKKTEHENMLLFSKERAYGPNRYRLYFTAISSLKDESPRVFRLLVRTPFSFAKFEIGRVYTLAYSKLHILKFEPKEEFNLQEEHFTKLLQSRDLKFIDKKTSAMLRAMDKPAFSKDRYYSFNETKEILNYRPDFLMNIAVSAFSAVVSGLAFLIPFCAYALMLYWLIKGQLGMVGFDSKALVLPIMGIGALPAALFSMSVLYVLCEFVLLRINFTKWSVLKKYTLVWGGIRKSFFFEIGDILYFKKFGIVSGAVIGVAIILSLIV
ncbi:MAG: hypothetical protein PHO15_06370 [Eubacteriales bacterium]|nr:hypothetical protein [Eubacteriales bacterium]